MYANRNAQTPKDRADQLIAEMDVIQRFIESVHELRRNVRAYEEQFGLPSTEIHEAIEDGRLIETLDVCEWIMDYEILCKAEADWNGTE